MGVNANPTTPTKFVETSFTTTVTDDNITELANELDSIIRDLRDRFDSDDLLEDVLRLKSGSDGIKSHFSKRGQDPEPLTQEAVIEPLLTTIGYNDWSQEVSGMSKERSEIADYSVPLTGVEDIDSVQLLIEAEPINKPLENRGHGVDQVESWLSQREFQTDFGFATDGFRWVFIRYDPDTYTHDRIEWIDLTEVVLALFLNQTGRQEPPQDALDDEHLETLRGFYQTFSYTNFLSIAGDAQQVIKATQESITDEFYDTYIEVVFGVRRGEDGRSDRSLIGEGVVEPDNATSDHTRLFSVKLMNRLIFIKFLEDKNIVRDELLKELVETYENGVYPESLYETFIERLFFDVMNKQPDDRLTRIQDIGLFSDVPYLNGGLFRPKLGESDEFDERKFDVRNSVLKSIIQLLEQYDFSADGGPTDLDPSVLGNVFEKTINYITSDPGDQNKQLGAYYTPGEITRFSAEQTIRPALYERLKPIAREELRWPEETFERYDTIYSLIEALPADMGVIGPMLDEIDEFRVVDPAMGSGHFLTSVLEEIVSIRKALYAQNESYPNEHRLKKTTVQNNIYGVDIVGPAVEIGKLRLWLSIISELNETDVEQLDTKELALPNIAFNLRQGNSLIGYVGFPDESSNGEYTLGKFSEQSVQERYEGIITSINKYENSIGEDAEVHRERANTLLENAREELIPKIQRDFHAAGVESMSQSEVRGLDPLNWVVEFAEVYADGGFDVAIGNPPWDVLRTNRDDFFSRYDPEFRSRMPEDKDGKMEELLEDTDVEQAWQKYNREMQARADYFNNSEEYHLQSPVVDGKRVTSENELSMLFLERVVDLVNPEGHVSFVIPNVIFTSASGKDLREYLMDEASIQSILHFENNGIFDGIDTRYRFGILTFVNSGTTESVRGAFGEKSLDIIDGFEEQTVEIPRKVLKRYSPEAKLFPQVSSVTKADSVSEVDILSKILEFPPLDEPNPDSWEVEIHRELDRTYDSDRFVESEDEGEYPVYGGKNIYQFIYDNQFLDVAKPEFWSVEESVDPELSAKKRIRNKEVKNLKTDLYDAFDGTGSQKQFVNELLKEARGKPLHENDVKLDTTDYRIVFRDITQATNERTFIASVIPPGIVCHSKLRTLRPHTVAPESEEDLEQFPLRNVYEPMFSKKELFVALGLLNSIPFDYLMRTKTYTTIVAYKVRESHVPRLTEGDDWFEYIWKRAAKLNSYGEAFEEIRKELGIEPISEHDQRKRTQAEIDAAAMHAYSIEQEEVKHLIKNFRQVKNPRLMDDEYFELVLQSFKNLD